MRIWLLAGLASAAIAGGLTDTAMAQARSGVVLVSARAEIAAALYSASATQAAAERNWDERLRTAQREIERLRGQGESARTALTAAQEAFVSELEQKNSAYQQEIAVFRQTVTEIAQTPEGRRALTLYAAGDPAAGREILRRTMERRAQAEQRAAAVRQAVDARQIATLDLDAMKRGAVDTNTVIADFELVTSLDAGQSGDWIELSKLYRDAGRLTQAEEAIRRGLEAARTPAERGRLQLERTSVFTARLDDEGAYAAAREAVARLTEAAAAEPNVIAIQRELLEARLRASDASSAEILAAVREAIARAPNDLSLQLTYLEVLAQLTEEAAEREDYREALEHIGVMMDAIDALQAPEGERIAVEYARARAAQIAADIAERNEEGGTQELELRGYRIEILGGIVDDNPTSATAREQFAMSLIEMGRTALEAGRTFRRGGVSDDGTTAIKEGVRILRELVAVDLTSVTKQLLLAGMMTGAGQTWRNAEPESAEALALWNDGVELLQRLARAHPTRSDLQNAAAVTMLMRIQQEADPAVKQRLMAEQRPRVRELAQRHQDDINLQTTYLMVLLDEAEMQVGRNDARATAAAEREAEEHVRRTVQRLADYPSARLEAANLYRGLAVYYLQKGATPIAIQRYDTAFEIQRAVWMADPEITTFRDELADSMIIVARRFYDRNDAEHGALYFRKAIDLYRGGVATGETEDWREMQLASKLSDFSDLLYERRDRAGARPVLEESLAVLQRRAAASPDNVHAQRLVGMSLRQLAIIAAQETDYDLSGRRLQEELTAEQAIAAAHPDSLQDQARVGSTLEFLADISYRRHEAAAALGHLQANLTLRRRIASAPTATAAEQEALAKALTLLGQAHERTRQPELARPLIDEALMVRRQIVTADTTSREAQLKLGEALGNAALVRSTARDFAGALTLFQEELSVRQRAGGDDPAALREVAGAHVAIGSLMHVMNRGDRGAASMGEAITILKPLAPQSRDAYGQLVAVMQVAQERGQLSAEDAQWLARETAAAQQRTP